MASIGGIQIPVDIVKQLMAGNHQAQEHVYEVLAKPVYSMALRVLGDTHAAEDVAQDTFIDVFTKAHTVREPTHFVGWVRTLAVNRCYMRLRSPWHRRQIDIEPDEAFESEDESTSDRIDIERALAAMDSKTRLVVWLFCVEGYTHEEIGKLLKRSTSYSKVIISRLSKNKEKEPAHQPKGQFRLSDPQQTYNDQWNAMTCQQTR